MGFVARTFANPLNRSFVTWLRGDSAARAQLITTQKDSCEGAPFILPADGFIGLLYADPRGPYSQFNRHQGIDIFSSDGIGVVPVYAAYDGYITREKSWVSTLIQRIPEDPLNPDAQIWLYYTHMADQDGNDFIEPAFEKGVSEVFVEQGTLLGYVGNYSGNPARPVGAHLHFSIVQDDGQGNYLNELDFESSLDSSAYLGLRVNYLCGAISAESATCTLSPTCE